MSHTPWDLRGKVVACPTCKINPTAYREVVEALEAARIFLPKDSDIMRQADEAIKHTQEPT